jgi:hypothetical protein
VKRLATLAGVLSMLTVVGGLAAFAAADTEFSSSSAALIAIGYLVSSLVALVGWLLVRAPWGRWSLVIAIAGSILLGSTLDSRATVVLYAIGAASLIALMGPWLRLWVRQHPPPGGLNRIALSLTIVSPLSPLVVGLAAYDTAHWSHWMAAFTASVGSWAYGRGLPMAVWSLRVAVPAASMAAFMTAPTPSRLLLASGASLVTVLAWLPEASQTSTFPNPPLPSPRPRRQGASDAAD